MQESRSDGASRLDASEDQLDREAVRSNSWTYLLPARKCGEVTPPEQHLERLSKSKTSVSNNQNRNSVAALPSRPKALVATKALEHPLHKEERFELQAETDVLGLLLPIPTGKGVRLSFSVDGWATTQEVSGEPEAGGDRRVYFRIPVGRDAVRQVTGDVGGEGRGIDVAVRYHSEEDSA